MTKKKSRVTYKIVPWFDSKKYVKSVRYRRAVDDVLRTLSVNLGIPFYELYNGLFFQRGTSAKGTLTITSSVCPHLEPLRKAFAEMVDKSVLRKD